MDLTLAFLIGLGLAGAVSLFARLVGLDRDRAFYPVVLIVIALLYSLFAVMGGSSQALMLEAAAGGPFILLAVLGFKRDLRIAAVGLAAHGIFDFFHGYLISNPGVPVFWPPFCLGYDVAAAAVLVWLQRRAGRP